MRSPVTPTEVGGVWHKASVEGGGGVKPSWQHQTLPLAALQDVFGLFSACEINACQSYLSLFLGCSKRILLLLSALGRRWHGLLWRTVEEGCAEGSWGVTGIRVALTAPPHPLVSG